MQNKNLFWLLSLSLFGCGQKPTADLDSCDNKLSDASEVCFEAPPLLASPAALLDAVFVDIDDDDIDDLVTATSDGNAFLFRGDPGGGLRKFNAAQDKILTNAPPGSKARRIFAQDINADTVEDLVLVVEEPNNRGAIYSLLRLSGDDFLAPVRSALNSPPIDAELFVTDSGARIVVLLQDSLEILQGDTSGTFANPRTQELTATAPRDIIPATIDADPLQDMFLADGFSQATKLIASQDGTFIESGFSSIPPSNAIIFDSVSGSGLDALSADAGVGSISLLRSLGNGDFEALDSFFVGDEPRDIKVEDFDGDGLPDLAVAGGITSSFLRGLGSGEFQESNPTWNGAGLTKIFTQDLTFDDAPDVIAIGSLGVSFIEGRLGSIPKGIEIPLGRERPKAAELGDFDRDGDLDLVLSINSGLMIAKNNGTGQFNFAAPQVIPLDPTPIALAVGDVDGDQDLDIISLDPQNPLDPNSEGTGRIIINQGGTFNPQSVLPVSNLPPGTISITSLDQNNDQLSDLITIGRTSAILQSDGQRFANLQAISANDAKQAALFDVNQDGVLDLVVGQSTSIKIFVGPAFTEEHTVTLNGSADVVSAADINQDGVADLVALNTTSPQLLVLLGQGDFSYKAPITAVVPEGAQAIAVGDCDANPGDDVLVVGSSLAQAFALDGQSLITRAARGAIAIPIGGVSGLLLNKDIDSDGTFDLVLPAQERGLLISRQKR